MLRIYRLIEVEAVPAESVQLNRKSSFLLKRDFRHTLFAGF